MSNQLNVLVILTDLTIGAVAFTCDYDVQATVLNIIRYEPLMKV